MIEPAAGFALTEEDASSLAEAALVERVSAVLAVPFDLERGPLFRAHLLRRSPTEHVLLLGGHHTVLDGWSVGLLLREASVLYRQATESEGSLPALAIQYADYASWQRATLRGDDSSSRRRTGAISLRGRLRRSPCRRTGRVRRRWITGAGVSNCVFRRR